MRVFGDKLDATRREQVLAHVSSGLGELGRYAGDRGVVVVIESHGDFVQSPLLKELLERAASPHVALLWDAHHTFAAGKEEPEQTFAALGKYVRHTHLKDSRPGEKERQMRSHRRRRRSRQASGADPREGGLQGRLLVRMGEALAPGDS